MLEFAGVYKFNLKDINFKIDKGDFLIIRGDGGAGKTTIVRLACGELAPDKGTIKVFGHLFGTGGAKQIPTSIKKKIGIIPQGGSLLENKNVFTNLAVPLKFLGKYDRRAVISVLNKLGLHKYQDRNINELPGSYRQLVKIALAMLKTPLLLLADEPLQNLDPEQSNIVLSTLEDMNISGTTVLFTASQTSSKYFSREIYIADGKIKS